MDRPFISKFLCHQVIALNILKSNNSVNINKYYLLALQNNLQQNVPQLVLSTNAQQNQQTQQQTMPRLITNIGTLQPQQQTTNHVQIRPVLTAMPQGGQLTLIQRPGQQAQLVQAAQIVQPQNIQKTIITRPQVVQVQQQTATQTQVTSQATTGTTIKVSAAGANATGQRRGLSLSVSLLIIV